MPSLLSSIVAPSPRGPPLVLLQSSAAQTCLPVLRAMAAQARGAVVLLCLLYPPASILGGPARPRPLPDRVRVVDRTANVPGYDPDAPDLPAGEWRAHLKRDVLEAVRNGALPPSPVPVPVFRRDSRVSEY